jgi:hypothetical protein
VEAATAKCKALEKENKLLRSATFDKVPVSWISVSAENDLC